MYIYSWYIFSLNNFLLHKKSTQALGKETTKESTSTNVETDFEKELTEKKKLIARQALYIKKVKETQAEQVKSIEEMKNQIESLVRKKYQEIQFYLFTSICLID